MSPIPGRSRLLLLLARLWIASAITALPQASVDSTPADVAPVVLEIGPHHRVVQHAVVAREPEGDSVLVTNTYTELATGLHYEDSGRWVESVPAFEEFQDHFVAQRGQHKVILSRNLGVPDAVDLLTPEGQRLRSAPRFIALRNRRTRETTFLAETRPECRGELVETNTVLWADAFEGAVRADVRAVYTMAGFEMDVILREQLPEPALLEWSGVEEDLEVLVLTEFLDAVEPEKVARELPDGSPDELLRFGSMLMDRGVAFLQPEDGARSGRSQIPSGKTLQTIDDRPFLVEATAFPALKPLLETLPPATHSAGVLAPRAANLEGALAAVHRISGPAGVLASGREDIADLVPRGPRDVGPSGRAAWSDRARRVAASPPEPRSFAMAANTAEVGRRRGVTLDYTQLVSGGSFVFRSDSTYYVLGPVTLGGNGNTVTLEGGSCIKYAPTGSPSIGILSGTTLNCLGRPYLPILFTAKDDNSVGENISGSTGNPSGYYAASALTLNGMNTDGYTLSNCRISYAAQAINAYYHNSGKNHTFRHMQFVRCGSAMGLDYGTFKVVNALVANSTATGNCVFDSNTYAYVDVEHLTVDRVACLTLNPSFGGLGLHNCLLVDVTTPGGTYTNDHTYSTTSANPVFEAVGGGMHYLPDGSPYRTLGNAPRDLEFIQACSQYLLPWDLTTRAPKQFTANFTGSLTLYPRPSGNIAYDDPDYGQPGPIGYHYLNIDYYWRSLELSNGTLTLTNSVVVAHGGTRGTYLKTGAHFVSENREYRIQQHTTGPNRILRYPAVQELPDPQEGTVNSFQVLYFSSATVDVTLRNTEVCFTSDNLTRRRLIPGTPFTGTVSLRDSRLWNTHLFQNNYTYATPTIRVLNCVLERCKLEVSQGYMSTAWPLSFEMYNCLIRSGWFLVTFYSGSQGTWNIRDNLFEGPTIAYTGPIPSSHNGFTTGTTALPGTGNKTGLTAAYEPLSPDTAFAYAGEYYYFKGDPPGPFWTALVDSGSRSPAAAGLVHHTVYTVNTLYYGQWVRQGVKEDVDPPRADIQVDIGFHYPTRATWDADGLPDWFEDADGDGEPDPSESHWKEANVDGDQLIDSDELLIGTNPRLANTDGDGFSDFEEYYWYGTNPLDNNIAAPSRLQYWRFNQSLTSEAPGGLAPLEQAGIVFAGSFEGYGLDFPSGATRSVKYLCGSAVHLKHGAVRFWYLPDWYHGNPTDAPGAVCTLLEAGLWRISISADGRYVVFETPNAAGFRVENCRALLPRQPGQPLGWEITVSYDRTRSRIEINGQLAEDSYTGGVALGVEGSPPTDQGFWVGNTENGLSPAQGIIDKLETFTFWPNKLESRPYSWWWDSRRRRSEILIASATSGSAIDLSWVRGFEGDLADGNKYRLERRVLGQTDWTNIAPPGGVKADTYHDATAVAGTLYEYRVWRAGGVDCPTTVAGLRATVATVHHRGRALVLVEQQAYADSNVRTALDTYVADLRGDGWTVVVNDAAFPQGVPWHDDTYSNESLYRDNLADIKGVIASHYTPSEPLVVVLVGHVTIPYSGNKAEDGHYGNLPSTPQNDRHDGAWPADLYYGDIDGVWTDANVTHSIDPDMTLSLRNMPGDGKFDQNTFPPNASGVAGIEIAVGRIDFANMPVFPLGEYGLLTNYFGKIHRYRTKAAPGYAVTHDWRLFTLEDRFFPLVESARSAATRLVASTALFTQTIDGEQLHYRPLADVFRTSSDYGTSLFRWGIHGGFGGSDYVTKSGYTQRRSIELGDPANEPHVLFYLLEGSYFGDWNLGPNPFMRACLSTTNFGLAAVWAFPGDPAWKLDRQAAGLHLGAVLLDSVNRFASVRSCRGMYILGDPTLVGYVVAPPGTVAGSVNGLVVTLTWGASPETSDYYIYRGIGYGPADVEEALENPPIALVSNATQYVDTVPQGFRPYTYVVRAVKEVHTGAGSFRNLSQGSWDSVFVP